MEWVKGPKVSDIPFFCTQLTERTHRFLGNIISPHKNICSMMVRPYKYSYISLQFNNTHSFLGALCKTLQMWKSTQNIQILTYIWKKETVIYGAASLRLICTCLQVGSNNFKSVIVQGVWDDLLRQSLDVLMAVVHQQQLKGIHLFNDISSLHSTKQ